MEHAANSSDAAGSFKFRWLGITSIKHRENIVKTRVLIRRLSRSRLTNSPDIGGAVDKKQADQRHGRELNLRKSVDGQYPWDTCRLQRTAEQGFVLGWDGEILEERQGRVEVLSVFDRGIREDIDERTVSLLSLNKSQRCLIGAREISQSKTSCRLETWVCPLEPAEELLRHRAVEGIVLGESVGGCQVSQRCKQRNAQLAQLLVYTLLLGLPVELRERQLKGSHECVHPLFLEEVLLERLVGEIARCSRDKTHKVLQVIVEGGASGELKEYFDCLRVCDSRLAVLGNQQGEDLAEVGYDGAKLGDTRGLEKGNKVAVEP
jgi:hypothetical protein